MREHEVPTHVQAEDRVLLWLTFPQIVSLIAVAAVSYGVFNYAPGPTGLRIGLAVVAGVTGAAAAVGQIGGRRLPLVAADLLKYWLGPRRFEGRLGDLTRPVTAPVSEVDSALMDKLLEKGRRRIRRLLKKRARRGGDGTRMQPGTSRRVKGKGSRRSRKVRRLGRLPFGRRAWASVGMIALLATGMIIPQVVAAQEEDGNSGNRFSEVDLELPPPVVGRRIYIEEIALTRTHLDATIRAATDISLRARAYGGESGEALRFSGMATVDEGESVSFTMPLDGDVPSFTFSWVDSLGQAGAVSIVADQLPHPLPSVKADLCDYEVTTLRLSRTTLSGTVATDCSDQVMESLSIETVSGVASVELMTMSEADVTQISGALVIRYEGLETNVSLMPDGDMTFSFPVDPKGGSHDVTIVVDTHGTLRVPMPPLVKVTTIPERIIDQPHVVSVTRPGVSRNVTETVSITCGDGTQERHTISAHLSIPGAIVEVTTIVPVIHAPHVTAEIVQRDPVARTRTEATEMRTRLWADTPYAPLVFPTPEALPETAEQVRTSHGVVDDLFARLGWEWPW